MVLAMQLGGSCNIVGLGDLGWRVHIGGSWGGGVRILLDGRQGDVHSGRGNYSSQLADGV